jgi:hypothetical protein
MHATTLKENSAWFKDKGHGNISGKMKSQCENFKLFSKFNMETIIMILCIAANLEIDYY